MTHDWIITEFEYLLHQLSGQMPDSIRPKSAPQITNRKMRLIAVAACHSVWCHLVTARRKKAIFWSLDSWRSVTFRC